MRERKLELGMGRGKRRGKGDEVTGSRAMPHGRVAG
jgi:hypothetical protein